MNVQKVALGRGWQWVQDGFQIFMRSPLQWIIMSLVIMGAMYLLGMIPLLGMPLICLLSPLAIAGMMAAARALDNGREINVNYLLWGFREGGSRLVFLGGVFFVAQLVIGAIVTNLAGPDATQLMSSGTMIDPKTITPEQANRLFTAMAVGMMLMVPVALMLWFAPALVVMDGVSAPQALMLSLRGCLANVIPTMIFGSAMMLLMMLVIISLGFGVFIWLPVAVTATYRSYVEVFGKAPAGTPQENTE
ncbi:MAG: hypothetical protein FJY37_11545 [Betaproteobacteria bacterium]|nr:hypothetical protein [Betaproteobacteria bacterium]